MKDLTQGNIYKNFILFGFPSVLAALLSQAYNMTDTIIAGKFLGAQALGAIGSTSALVAFASSVFWGFSVGVAMFCGSLFGAGDYKSIKSMLYHGVIATFVVSSALAVAVIVFCDPILNILRADVEIYADAKTYVCIYMVGFSLIILSNTFMQILHALGITAFPFYMALLSAILNVFGNIFAVTVLKLGVGGVAGATVLSALVVDICYVMKLRSCFKKLGVAKERVTFDGDLMRRISARSLPTGLQQTVMYTASILVSPIVNGLGGAASASYSVVMQIYNFIAGIYQNSAKTVSTYTAHCVGAGKSYKDMQKGVLVGLIQGLMFAVIPLFVCSVFAREVCEIFFPAGYSGDGLEYAVTFGRIYLPFIVFNVINNLFHAFYRGTATLKWLFSLTAIGSVVRVLASLWLSHFGMDGVFAGWVISWIIEAVVASITFFAGVWKKDALRY